MCQQTCHPTPPGKLTCCTRPQVTLSLQLRLHSLLLPRQCKCCLTVSIQKHRYTQDHIHPANASKQCHLPSRVHACRTFDVPLNGGPNPGNLTITGNTTTPDSNPNNNQDTVIVRLQVTCADPLGTGVRPACPAGSVFTGPGTLVLGSSTEFDAKCCVSITWGVNIWDTSKLEQWQTPSSICLHVS